MNISTLKPGLLVSLHTDISGNVQYQRYDTEPEHYVDGTKRSAWETTRVVLEPDEHERAIKARSKARSLITGVCTQSRFGYLCPKADRERLEDAITQAQALAADFNMSAAITRIGVYVVIGEVAANDLQYIRSLNAEVRSLIDQMTVGVQKLDVKAVREAAQKARDVSAMLEPGIAEKVRESVAEARRVARRIVKAGEAAAVEVDTATLRKISEARMSFLDLDDTPVPQTPVEYDDGRAIDLDVLDVTGFAPQSAEEWVDTAQTSEPVQAVPEIDLD